MFFHLLFGHLIGLRRPPFDRSSDGRSRGTYRNTGVQALDDFAKSSSAIDDHQDAVAAAILDCFGDRAPRVAKELARQARDTDEPVRIAWVSVAEKVSVASRSEDNRIGSPQR